MTELNIKEVTVIRIATFRRKRSAEYNFLKIYEIFNINIQNYRSKLSNVILIRILIRNVSTIQISTPIITSFLVRTKLL